MLRTDNLWFLSLYASEFAPVFVVPVPSVRVDGGRNRSLTLKLPGHLFESCALFIGLRLLFMVLGVIR